MVSRALTVFFVSFIGLATAVSVDLLPSTHDLLKTTPPHSLPPAPFSAPIVSKAPRKKSKTAQLHSFRSNGKPNTAQLAVLDGALYDNEYLVDITVGGQKFKVIVDTGSWDTWVAKKGFKCLDLSGRPVSQDTCAFGTHGFDQKLSHTFKSYPDTKFSIAYGDGEFLDGVAGKETLNVSGLAVTQQAFGLATKAAWTGDGINTGLLGLAYPNLTSVKSTHGKHIIYDPFFFTAVKENKVSHSYFSLALNRGPEDSKGIDPNLGYLSFGGIAPVAVIAGTLVTVPIQAFTFDGQNAANSSSNSSYFFYTVDLSSFVFPNSSGISSANNRTIIDSGTTLNFLPSSVAQAYNALWKSSNWESGAWFVDCDEVAPPFAVEISGKAFAIDPKDQVVHAGVDDNGKDICLSGTQDGGDDVEGNMFVLGDVFLHNVVVTFDVHKNEMTFVQREDY